MTFKMYIENKKETRLIDLMGENIFSCKKDIKCENGTFLKGSLVYLSFSHDGFPTRVRLFNVDDWNSAEGLSIFCCSSDCCLEEITVNNFYDYFNLEENVTSKFAEINKEAKKYDALWMRFISLRDFFILKAAFVTAIIGVFLSLSISDTIFFSLAITLTFLLFGLAAHIANEVIYSKRGKIYKQRRNEVVNATIRNIGNM